jgi:predicted nucleic acid-binding protein
LAFLDANVLFSRTLRDWICLLALDSDKTAFGLRWSEDVLAEWVYQMRRKRPDIPDDSLGRFRRWLAEAFPEAMVRGYRPSDVPRPPDIHDWHVLAAAACVPVDFLVTADRRGFVRAQTRDLGVDILSPDEFLNLIADRHPDLVELRLAHQIDYLRGRRRASAAELREEGLAALTRAGAVRFAERLRGDVDTLDGLSA